MCFIRQILIVSHGVHWSDFCCLVSAHSPATQRPCIRVYVQACSGQRIVLVSVLFVHALPLGRSALSWVDRALSCDGQLGMGPLLLVLELGVQHVHPRWHQPSLVR